MAAFMFCPGIETESNSYAQPLHNFAERGILCVVPTILFNASVFNEDVTDGNKEHCPQINTWYIAVHPLGGVSALQHVANRPN